jgi:hypothetical protein
MLIALLLPAGSLFGAKLYFPVFMSCIFLISLYIIKIGFSSIHSRKVLISSILSLSFLLFWLFIGINQNEQDLAGITNQFKLFFMTIYTCYISLFLYYEKIIEFDSFIKKILLFCSIYCLLKVITSVLLLSNLLSIKSVIIFLDQILDFKDFLYGDTPNGLPRFQFQNDTIIPFIIYFILNSESLEIKLNSVFKKLVLPVLIINVYVTFARYIWMITLAAILLSANIFEKLRKKYIFRTYVVLMISISALVVLVICNLDSISTIFVARFNSYEVVESDSIRSEQFNALFAEIIKYPIFGKGLGGYAPSYIREATYSYAYELQWISFLLQFGILGIAILLIHILYILGKLTLLLKNLKYLNLTLGTLILYVFWIFSGFTNPYLISPVSGFIFSLFALTCLHLKKLIYKEPSFALN